MHSYDKNVLLNFEIDVWNSSSLPFKVVTQPFSLLNEWRSTLQFWEHFAYGKRLHSLRREVNVHCQNITNSKRIINTRYNAHAYYIVGNVENLWYLEWKGMWLLYCGRTSNWWCHLLFFATCTSFTTTILYCFHLFLSFS